MIGGALHPGAAVVLLAAGLVLSAFFSGSETGYMSTSRVRLRRSGADASAAGRRLLAQLRRIEDPILTCLIGTNLSNVVLTAVLTLVLTERYGERGEWLSMLIAGTAVIVFGEIVPKVLYREYPEATTLASSRLIQLAMILLAPVRWILNGYTALLRLALPGGSGADAGSLDRRRVAALLLGHGAPPAQDRRFKHVLDKYLALASRRVGSVMRPIDRVVTISSATTVGECLDAARRSGYSRLPVRSDSGALTGYVLVRDLLFLHPDEHAAPVPRRLVRRLLLVDRRMSPYGLFEEMRYQEKQLAVVVDTAGNPQGMITLEDLIEAVFGSLRDEFDRE